MKKFNHLNIPQHWEQYWSKYPNGYSILESLIDWVSQVDDMVDNQNALVDHVDSFKESVNVTTDGFRSELDSFLSQFDTNLSSKVIDTLSEWQSSGFLDVVIDSALDTKYHEMDDRLTAQLAQKETLTPVGFGAVGDGLTDDTLAINDMINYAKEHNKKIYLDGVYKITGSEPLDITDISLDGQNGVLDFSEFTGENALISNGSREVIKNNVSVSKGTHDIIDTYSDLKQGDIIVIKSDEQIPNTYRDVYRKGGVHYVQSYINNVLRVYPAFEFDYINATLEVIRPSELSISRGVTIKGKSGGNQRGLLLENTRFNIGAHIKNFGLGGVGVNYSIGNFTGFIRDTYILDGTTNYGISISDCSHVHILGAEIWGGRHSVASGGNYPSKITINGGYYAGLSNVNHAIDAHGVVKELIVTGAIVVGGIQSNADYSIISNNTITFNNVSGVLIGSDNNSKQWGSYSVTDNIIKSLGTPDNPDTAGGIVIFNSIRELTLKGNSVAGQWGGSTSTRHTPLWFTAEADRIIIKDNFFKKEVSGGLETTVYITGNTLTELNGNVFVSHGLLVRGNTSGVMLSVKDNTVIDSNGHGIRIAGYSDRQIAELICHGNIVRNSRFNGMLIEYARELSLKNNRSVNNGQETSGVTANRSGISVRNSGNVIFSNNETKDTQSTGTQSAGLHIPDSDTVAILGNDFRGCPTPYAIGTTTLLERQGNVNMSDYIRGSDGTLYEFDGTNFIAK